jgi:hypothetical protein
VNSNDIIDLQGPDLRMIACKQTFTMHVYNRDYESDILGNQKEVWLYRQLSAKIRLIGWLLASHKDTKCTSNSTSNIYTLLSWVPSVILFWIPSFSSVSYLTFQWTQKTPNIPSASGIFTLPFRVCKLSILPGIYSSASDFGRLKIRAPSPVEIVLLYRIVDMQLWEAP